MNGADGADGSDGADGIPGVDGCNGTDGEKGPPGPVGPKGEPVSAMSWDNRTLFARNVKFRYLCNILFDVRLFYVSLNFKTLIRERWGPRGFQYQDRKVNKDHQALF